ncbi:MAG: InlB B-repeat-containing protein [Candidatus Bathyarchaeota archaeon]|nr:InlB B-repeat-containing protein [Candidatus Termiticorpusculum sp.]
MPASFLMVNTTMADGDSIPSVRIVQESGVDGGYKLVFTVTAVAADLGKITNFNVILSCDNAVVIPVDSHTGMPTSVVSVSLETSMTLLTPSWTKVYGRSVLSVTVMDLHGVNMSGGCVVVEFYFRYADGVTAVDVYDSAFLLTSNPVGDAYMIQLGSDDGTSYYYGSIDDTDHVINLEDFIFGLPESTYAVTYDANDGLNAPMDSSSPYVFGTSVTVLGQGSVQKNGFIFNGWSANSTAGMVYQPSDSFIITGVTVFYAVWTETPNSPGGTGNPTTYSVTYNANGGTEAPVDNNRYAQGVTVTILPSVPVRSGYSFAGWLYNGVTYYSGDTFVMLVNNVALVAQWKEGTSTTYTIIYNASAGVNPPIDSNSPYISGATVTVLGQNSMSRSGYTFNGWSVNSTTGQTFTANNTFTITGDTTFYAIWTETTTPTKNSETTITQAPTLTPPSTPTLTPTLTPPTQTSINESVAEMEPIKTNPPETWTFWRLMFMACTVLVVSIVLAFLGINKEYVFNSESIN